MKEIAVMVLKFSLVSVALGTRKEKQRMLLEFSATKMKIIVLEV